ncbi:MAG TPA: hypothetical protein VIQ54_21905 [Polyangia bacterium]
MQVSCGNCQLSFDAPEGATGLVCPICRGPLLPKSADGASPAAKATQEWSGGDLDDLIAILSGPALSARVEVLGATGDAAVGEVHLLAGGVSDALFGGKSTDDALDKLRAAKPTRFRVEQRLPNPTDGDLTYPGPDSGTLESRALAHLMRYCEDYVITAGIEVWRGNENARVEYKRGEIGNVTVGGIDAPERLAEVMQWASGNYRLVVQPLKLPAVAPKRPQAAAAAAAKVPAPAPSAQAARHASATKTIFGMPAAEIIKARAAAEAAKAAAATRTTSPTSPATPSTVAQPPAASAAPPPAAAPVKVTPPGVAPTPVPAPVSRPSTSSATKTIFGVPTPGAAGYTPVTQPSASASAAPVAAAPAAAAPTSVAGAIEDRSKTGARKVAVPAPEVSAAPAAAADDPAATRSGYDAPAAEAPKRPSTPAPVVAPKPVPAPAPAAAGTDKLELPKRETPIWTYVIVGVVFGAALIGIYQLVGLLAH